MKNPPGSTGEMLEQDLFLFVDTLPDRLGGHAHLKADLVKGHAVNQSELEHLPIG